MMATIRTRFAPSPTGLLHIGGGRTALFSWLQARHAGGRFVLRIEDTDKARSTRESVDAILDGMAWLGLDYDEGPHFQSENEDRHRGQLAELEAEGALYRCWCTAEGLQAARDAAIREGRPPVYNRRCRDRTDAPDLPYALRFRTPLDREVRFVDQVRGEVVFQSGDLDDFIVARSDGSPTYNFVVVVDDADMEITHVIRGDDHLTNTPKQILLYQALGRPVPTFAHVPLLLGVDRQRLSKRHGATAITAYRDLGYLPEAMLNYLARLGWSHGDQEIFTREELVEKFDVSNVGASPAVFDPQKLDWLNEHYLKTLPLERLVPDVRKLIEERGHEGRDDAWIARMIETLRERSTTLVGLVDAASYYLKDEIEIDGKAAAKFLKPAAKPLLADLIGALEATREWSEDAIREAFETVMAKHDVKLGKLAQPVRVAVTGGTVSPGIHEMLEVVGRERSLDRLRQAAESIADAA